MPTPTQSQIDQFSQYITSGNNYAAVDLARSAGFSDDAIAKYYNENHGVDYNQATGLLSAYKPPAATPVTTTAAAPVTPATVAATPVTTTAATATAPVTTTNTATTAATATPRHTPEQEQGFAALIASGQNYAAVRLARNAGYTDDEIARYYQANHGVDYNEAMKQLAEYQPNTVYNEAMKQLAEYQPNTVGSGTIVSVPKPTAVPPRTITPQETVSHQLNTLLSENSPYMQSATNRAMEQANSRGLLNSSIAVGAGQRAAIDAALPIAQQDAKTYADSGMAAQNYGFQTALNEQNFGFQKSLNDQNIQGNISIANNAAQRDTEKTNLMAEIDRLKVERAAEIDKAINDAKYQWESILQKQRDDANSTLQTTLKQMDIDYDLGKLAQADRDSYGQAAYPIIQQTQAEIAKINTTPDSQLNEDGKDTAIAGLQTQMRTQLQNLGKIYGYELDWEQPDLGLLSEKSNSATTQKDYDFGKLSQADRDAYKDNLPYWVADANPNLTTERINQALSGIPRATILARAESGGGTINGVYIPGN